MDTSNLSTFLGKLFYVIKYIIGNEKGKYEKARRLFSGPKWLGKGEFKDHADYADVDFRKALNALYPDACIVKGHEETVKEPVKHTEWAFIPENINKDSGCHKKPLIDIIVSAMFQ